LFPILVMCLGNSTHWHKRIKEADTYAGFSNI
jgi:hypothetical protein